MVNKPITIRLYLLLSVKHVEQLNRPSSYIKTLCLWNVTFADMLTRSSEYSTKVCVAVCIYLQMCVPVWGQAHTVFVCMKHFYPGLCAYVLHMWKRTNLRLWTVFTWMYVPTPCSIYLWGPHGLFRSCNMKTARCQSGWTGHCRERGIVDLYSKCMCVIKTWYLCSCCEVRSCARGPLCLLMNKNALCWVFYIGLFKARPI